MDARELLPIGSVVRVRDANKNMMIIGIAQIDGDEQYDYLAVLYPEGYLTDDQIYVFNHQDIEDISFLGFANAEHQVFRSELNEIIAEYNNGVTRNDKDDTE